MVLVLYGWLLAHPGTRPLAVEMVQENRPVELLTFVFLMQVGLVLGFIAGAPAISLLLRRGVKAAA